MWMCPPVHQGCAGAHAYKRTWVCLVAMLCDLSSVFSLHVSLRIDNNLSSRPVRATPPYISSIALQCISADRMRIQCVYAARPEHRSSPELTRIHRHS